MQAAHEFFAPTGAGLALAAAEPFPEEAGALPCWCAPPAGDKPARSARVAPRSAASPIADLEKWRMDPFERQNPWRRPIVPGRISGERSAEVFHDLGQGLASRSELLQGHRSERLVGHPQKREEVLLGGLDVD